MSENGSNNGARNGNGGWTPAPASPEAPVIAFYAPMKAPGHPTPSGDRQVARLLWRALEIAGFAPVLASEFRSWRAAPDAAALDAARADGMAEAKRLIEHYDRAPAAERPKLWFTYHLYYKAPDFLGPRVAALHGMPYVVAEASRAAKRLEGDWAEYAKDAEAAIDLADVILCKTERDRPALEAGRVGDQRIEALPPFLDHGPAPAPRPVATPPRLLSVAMMRPGDKLRSYETLAAALSRLEDLDWTLEIVGDGPERAAVEALFAPFGDRVTLAGAIQDPALLRQRYEQADLFLWPGVGEAYGMVYLEAQAAGTPVVAEDRPGVRDVAHAGALTPPDDPAAYSDAIRELLADPEALAGLRRKARFEIESRHGLASAAEALRGVLSPLLPTTP